MTMTDRPTVHIDTAPALIASLPQQYGEPIPARALVLLLLKATGEGYSTVENITVSPINWLDRYALDELRSGMLGTTAIAVVIDDTAEYGGLTGFDHSLLIDDAAFHLRDRGIHLEATYAARAVTADQPVWSIENDAHLGPVPEPQQAPPLATYALADEVTARPAIRFARSADY